MCTVFDIILPHVTVEERHWFLMVFTRSCNHVRVPACLRLTLVCLIWKGHLGNTECGLLWGFSLVWTLAFWSYRICCVLLGLFCMYEELCTYQWKNIYRGEEEKPHEQLKLSRKSHETSDEPSSSLASNITGSQREAKTRSPGEKWKKRLVNHYSSEQKIWAGVRNLKCFNCPNKG